MSQLKPTLQPGSLKPPPHLTAFPHLPITPAAHYVPRWPSPLRSISPPLQKGLFFFLFFFFNKLPCVSLLPGCFVLCQLPGPTFVPDPPAWTYVPFSLEVSDFGLNFISRFFSFLCMAFVFNFFFLE